ncbi:hypothetical protein L2E82_11149 [Cichorium intybus]|uniref:Uncharacterized protein n=1 Tax=Cichorium intybus TaxID=13427 RepID=A0ACB9GCF3_CICIN|nr:hypothetical protein L2E82_11149 [Cichorium intybus]
MSMSTIRDEGGANDTVFERQRYMSQCVAKTRVIKTITIANGLQEFKCIFTHSNPPDVVAGSGENRSSTLDIETRNQLQDDIRLVEIEPAFGFGPVEHKLSVEASVNIFQIGKLIGYFGQYYAGQREDLALYYTHT